MRYLYITFIIMDLVEIIILVVVVFVGHLLHKWTRDYPHKH